MISLGVNAARRSVFAVTACLCLGVAVVGSAQSRAIAVPGTYNGTVVQIGTASTDANDRNSVGVAAYLGHEPMPQTFVDQAAGYFWIGLTLPDSTFLQVGTVTHGDGCSASNYGYFVQWAQNGKYSPNWLVAPCGQTISTYGEFSITAGNPSPTTGYCTWSFETPAGLASHSLADADCNSGTHTPGVVIELSGSAKVSTSDTLGPAGALPVTITQHSVGGPFQDTAHANALFNSAAFCPPPNVVGKDQGFASDSDHAGMGSPTSYFSYGCTSNGTHLW